MKIIVTGIQLGMVGKLLTEQKKQQGERYDSPEMSTVLFELQKSGKVPKSLKVEKFRMFDEYIEMEDISNQLHDILKNTPDGIPRDKFIDVIKSTDRLIKFGRMLNHPINLYIFVDKTGNEFIQARSSIMDKVDGKKTISVYLGSTNVYKGGINDEEANMRGRMGIYKKLRKYFLGE